MVLLSTIVQTLILALASMTAILASLLWTAMGLELAISAMVQTLINASAMMVPLAIVDP
jgi:hypothetical protein